MVHGSAIREELPVRTAMRQRKHAMTGLRAISWEQRLLGVLTPPCSTRASRPAPWQAGAGCGNPKAERMALRVSCASSSRRSPVPTSIRATLRSSSGHRRWGRSWSATRRAGTVSEITQAHEGARCSKVAGNVVALQHQQCKRVNGCAGMAQVFAAIEAEQAGPQSVPTKNAA
jgi:hypothetical protein